MVSLRFWRKNKTVKKSKPHTSKKKKKSKKTSQARKKVKTISVEPVRKKVKSKKTETKGVELNLLQKHHLKKKISKTKKKTSKALDLKKLKIKIKKEVKSGKLKKHHAAAKLERKQICHTLENSKHKKGKVCDRYIKTHIPGFDELFSLGVPRGSSIVIAGGAGSGKTIMCLQMLSEHAQKGKKCLYMSFEESEERLQHHMQDFGWKPNDLIKKGNLLIKRFNPFDITRSVDALLLEAKGELLIDIEPIIFPKNFKPDFIVVDSLTAIASAFAGKEDSYRIYIEQLFRFFERLNTTSFLITETKQMPTIFSQTGVEEFLADGVFVLYNFKKGNMRENAIEVLKLRGAKHRKAIVSMRITEEGVVVYPQQEVEYSTLDS